MAQLQPADTLRSRTFIGLLIAQFLAAFNDQAIHASSMFFAINQRALSLEAAISLMPILFYAPWAVFCTLAGYLADRYSKRSSLIFWKFVEIGITLLALLGFWMGTHGSSLGPVIVLSTVFLMGTHSAFFVPAKYGAMPEILQPQMLSRGNGLLESLSFLAIILGTVCGGILSQIFRGQEYYIGLVLVALAIVGAAASLLIQRMPAANPTRPFPPYLYGPLRESLRGLFRSRPLTLAVTGIAFFTFIVAFMRATVYMHGQSHVPPWDEARTSEIVGMVALGIGLGSPLVGYLSGGKVELGLVPVGAVGMIVTALAGSLALERVGGLIACLILLGFFTGFYIVPLFTLLQHRALTTSKGDAVATSNLINVTGAMVASLLFSGLVLAAHVSGIAPRLEERDRARGVLAEPPEYEHGRPTRFVIERFAPDVLPAATVGRLVGPCDPWLLGPLSTYAADEHLWRRVVQTRESEEDSLSLEVEDEALIDVLGPGLKKGDRVVESVYRLGNVKHHRLRRDGVEPRPVHDHSRLPSLLFAGAGLMSIAMLLVLLRQMPDLFLRTLVWLRLLGRYRLDIEGMHHLPSRGPVLLVTNAAGHEDCLTLLSATDRTTCFVLLPSNGDPPLPWPVRVLARWTSLACLPPGGGAASDWDRIQQRSLAVLQRRGVVGLPLGNPEAQERIQQLYTELAASTSASILPVCFAKAPYSDGIRLRSYVLAAPPLAPGSSLEEVRQELQRLGREMKHLVEAGAPLPHAVSSMD